jgi:hypothetical protein
MEKVRNKIFALLSDDNISKGISKRKCILCFSDGRKGEIDIFHFSGV